MSNRIKKLTVLHDIFNKSDVPYEKKALKFYHDITNYEEISYKDLKEESRVIGDALSTYTGEKSPVIFGIYCDPGPHVIAHMLGSLLNAAFIYLSPGITQSELLNIANRIPLLFLIIDEHYINRIQGSFSSVAIVNSISVFGRTCLIVEIHSLSKSSHCLSHNVHRLAYVMLTSGSTGEPKIVFVPHECIVPNINDFLTIFEMSSNDIILSLSPLTFDPSIIDIFVSLNCGASLILLSLEMTKKPSCLEFVLKDNPISVMQITPTLFGTLNSSFVQDHFFNSKSLRIVAFGGEPFPQPIMFRHWFHPDNRLKVFNLYGLTEISCWASCLEVNLHRYLEENNAGGKSISLGTPLTGTDIYLVDSNDHKLTEGIGEIVIGGSRNICVIMDKNVSPRTCHSVVKTGDVGYSDGLGIFFRGRSDNIVKRNAHKISLLEIEAVTKLHDQIADCSAVFFENEIFLFFSSESKSLTEYSILVHLKTHLSPWKLPRRVFRIDKLPITSHGKLDRKLLVRKLSRMKVGTKSLNRSSHSVIDIVKTMQSLWEESLFGCKPKEKDNFISLGGTSIQAITLAEKIQEIFGDEHAITLDLLLNKTFQDICSYFSEEKVEHLSSSSKVRPHLKRKRSGFGNKSSESYVHGLVSNEFILVNMSLNYACRGGSFIKNNIFPSIKDINLQLKWKANLLKCIDSSPLVVEYRNQRRVFIGSHSYKFLCVNGNVGRVIWDIDLPDRIEASASLSGNGEALYIGCYDGNLYCLSLIDGKQLWKYSTDGMIKSTAVVDYETWLLYFGSYDKHLYCLHPNGGLLWRFLLSGGSIYSSPVIRDGDVYAGTLDGVLVSLKKYEGTVNWKREIGKPIFSSLASYSRGIVFGCTDGFVYCFGFESELLWRYNTSGPIFSSPFIVENSEQVLIAIGSHDHTLYVLNESGIKIDTILFSSPIFSTPFVLNQNKKFLIFLSETSGLISMLSLDLGEEKLLKLMGNHKLEQEVFSSPVYYGGALYVGCRDNFLYCFECNEN